MEVGVLTWFKACNHGAVLQAYALRSVLTLNGYSVELLDYTRQISDCRNLREKMISKLKKASFNYINNRRIIRDFDIEKRSIFDKFISENSMIGENWRSSHCDNIIVGSDMVFNLKQGFSPYMFGIDVPYSKIFSYAASAGGSDKKLAMQMGIADEISLALKRFSVIGYRDESTKKFVQAFNPNANFVENIDPVILYGFSKERELWDTGKWKSHKPYILVYAYHGCMDDKKEIQQIKKYARKNDLQIISCGYYHNWCDENINASPYEFIEMFSNANSVVTDTFHGTVFSLIFRIHFVSIIRQNGFKLVYLLKTSGLENRIVSQTENLCATLEKPMLWDTYNIWETKNREQSLNYILNELR